MSSRLTAVTAAALIFVAAGASAQSGRGGAPNGTPFQALQTQVTDLRTQVASIQQQMASLATLQEQLEALAASVASNSASIEELRQFKALQEQQIAALGGALLALQSALAGTQGDVEALQLRDTLMQQWLAALDQQWRDAEARLAANTGDIQLLVDADRALQELIGALQQQLGFLQTAVGDVAGLAGSLQLSLIELQAALNTKQTQIQGACPAGSSIRQIDATGAVACEFDDVGTGGGPLSTIDIWTYFVDVPPGLFGYALAYCPTGYLSLSGGFSVPMSVSVFYNGPMGTLGWMAGAVNQTASPARVVASLKCAAQ